MHRAESEIVAAEAAPTPREGAGAVEALSRFVARSQRLVVLTGAGCSTESGIPDYRDADGSWKGAEPMRYQRFVAHRDARRRYWARAMVGWPRMAGARPNAAHRALAALEAAGRVHALITQNVDGLHERAGSRRVLDLHGRLDRVQCVGCSTVFPRGPFQGELERRNPSWRHLRAPTAPDGDARLDAEDYSTFELPTCLRCGGDLKPHVVFFGESVPAPRTAAAFARLAEADGLLVVGSSLMVWSGYRFARETVRTGKPLALLNLGTTRADAEATLKVEGRCGDLLPRVVEHLGCAEGAS